MRYIGNYQEWITPELLNILLNNDGEVTPVYQPDKWSGRPDYDDARKELESAGYPAGNHYFCQYTKDTECLQHLDIKMPFDIDRVYHWWIIKLNPGQMQPMHFDPHVKLVENCKRYTMPLADYVPGHVFVYDDYLLKNYRAGDMFEWDDSSCYHGVVNISYTPRLTLQISIHD